VAGGGGVNFDWKGLVLAPGWSDFDLPDRKRPQRRSETPLLDAGASEPSDSVSEEEEGAGAFDFESEARELKRREINGGHCVNDCVK
jgi:hypothetical protein